MCAHLVAFTVNPACLTRLYTSSLHIVSTHRLYTSSLHIVSAEPSVAVQCNPVFVTGYRVTFRADPTAAAQRAVGLPIWAPLL
eukprot:5707832-Prymnesium_polylepis.1